jgi:plasmid maintenance system antidote protein VapI
MAKKKSFPTGNRKLAPKRKRTDRARKSRRKGPLAAWLKAQADAATPITLTDFAAKVDLSVQHVSNLVHGHTLPSREAAVAIAVATQNAVPVESWG